MHENVFASLAADKAVALGVVEPLNCSLFHILVLLFLLESYVGGSREKLAQVTCCLKARAAHDRIGLTHNFILRANCAISKRKFHVSATALFAPLKSSIRRFISHGVVSVQQKWSVMERKTTQRCNDTKPIGSGVEDSPTIQNLIQQLNRDLEETQRNDSKAE